MYLPATYEKCSQTEMLEVTLEGKKQTKQKQAKQTNKQTFCTPLKSICTSIHEALKQITNINQLKRWKTNVSSRYRDDE